MFHPFFARDSFSHYLQKEVDFDIVCMYVCLVWWIDSCRIGCHSILVCIHHNKYIKFVMHGLCSFFLCTGETIVLKNTTSFSSNMIRIITGARTAASK